MPVSAFYLTRADSEGAETAPTDTRTRTHKRPLLSGTCSFSFFPPPFLDTVPRFNSFHLQSRLQSPRLCRLSLYCCICLSVVLLRKQRERYQKAADSIVLVTVTEINACSHFSLLYQSVWCRFGFYLLGNSA